MDSGPIICQTVLPISPSMNKTEIGSQLFIQSRDAWLQTISWLSEGRVKIINDRVVFIENANYSALPICPALELTFPPYNPNFY